MKKINIWLLIICTTLFLCLSVLIIVLQNNYRKLDFLANKNVLLKNKLIKLESQFCSSYDFEGKKVDPNVVLVSDSNSCVKIIDLVKPSSKLFIYLNSPNCPPCVDNLTQGLLDYKNEISSDNIIFYGNFVNQRYMKTMQNSCSVIRHIYKCKDKGFIDLFSTSKVPIMFVLDRDLKVCCVYEMDKTMSSSVLKSYIKTISERFEL